jgi:uncharacterized tellurite resistance protein B-like protein
MSALYIYDVDHPYHLSLLYLTHLLISADGTIDTDEVKALELIRKRENIPSDLFESFLKSIEGKNERELFQLGVDTLNYCNDEEKFNVFVILYKLAEVDGRVHIKEIKMLLFTLRLAQIDFEDVVNKAIVAPPLI